MGSQSGLNASHCFKYVYENTSAGSPLRRPFVDQHIVRFNPAIFFAVAGQYPHEMLIDLAMALVDSITPQQMTAF
jgi:hypothetical protein